MLIDTITISQTLLNRVAGESRMRARVDYSGRGMYGRTCAAIVGDTPGLVRFSTLLGALAHNPAESLDTQSEARALLQAMERVRQDDMGLNTVYYWPSVSVRPQD